MVDDERKPSDSQRCIWVRRITSQTVLKKSGSMMPYFEEAIINDSLFKVAKYLEQMEVFKTYKLCNSNVTLTKKFFTKINCKLI